MEKEITLTKNQYVEEKKEEPRVHNHTILIVDDEKSNVMALNRTFRKSYNVLMANSGDEALQILNEKASEISLIIADQRMPKMTGVELFEKVMQIRPEIIKIMLTGYTDIEDIIDAINKCDLYQYITKPWEDTDIKLSVAKAIESYERGQSVKEKSLELEKLNFELEKVNMDLEYANKNLALEVEKRTAELVLANKELEMLAITDPLTGVHNRRYFEERLKKEFIRVTRYKHPLSIVMMDLDHFKQFNDKHGHLLGDAALKEVASILSSSVRTSDFVSRYGGEEFVMTLPETNKQGAFEIAERIRKKVAAFEFIKYPGKKSGNITLSIGIAAFPEDIETTDSLLKLADQALYIAKNGGRNRTILYKAKK